MQLARTKDVNGRKQLQILSSLLDCFADMSVIDEAGNTILHHLLMRDADAFLRLLLRRASEHTPSSRHLRSSIMHTLRAPNRQQETPWSLAVGRHAKVLPELILCCANEDALREAMPSKSLRNEALLALAADDKAYAFSSNPVLRAFGLLIASGADPRVLDDSGKSAQDYIRSRQARLGNVSMLGRSSAKRGGDDGSNPGGSLGL